MSRLSCSIMLALSVSLITFGPTVTFANSSNPKCGTFDCSTTGAHGGSTNTCVPGSPGCNTVITTKHNPAGNNQTNTCTSPNKNVC
jgi:hypothetical protein